ncbi:MAG: type II toxin-antitoxin system RelE/ParE family toxin [Alphaproteobacteria bacterium]|nr:type II toxin-antitoxin system RelE/ParE family toxin [Alphaproteobacteria bacterium]
MQIVYEKQAIKTLAKMPVKTARQINEKIASFAARSGKQNLDIETLKGVDGGFRLRQGDWRALMLAEGETLRVVAIKPRGDAYK